MPTGTLMKKIHDQLSALREHAAEQDAGRGAEAAEPRPRRRARCCARDPRERGRRIDSAAGEITAAPSPWTERPR